MKLIGTKNNKWKGLAILVIVLLLTTHATAQYETITNALKAIYILLTDILKVQSMDKSFYNMHISTESNFSTVIQDKYTPTSRIQIDDLWLSTGTYYTKVRNFDSGTHTYGRWSSTLTFYVNESKQLDIT